MSVQVPGQYQAWTSWLDAFARGEDLPMNHLRAIGSDLGPYMQERLVERLAEAFTARVGVWNRTVTDRLCSAQRRGMDGLAGTLVQLRGQVRPLIRLSESPLVPAELRAQLREAVTTLVESAQDSLERSARSDHRLASALLPVVKQNALTTVLTERVQPDRTDSLATRPADVAPGRRIIL